MKLLDKQQLADEMGLKTSRTIDKYLSLGLKPVTRMPLRFTVEAYVEWENNYQKTKGEKNDEK